MRVCALLALLCATIAHAEFPKLWVPPYVNGVAARVNESIITYDDIRRELAGFSAELKRKNVSEEEYHTQMQRAQSNILDGLIERRLLIEEFRKKDYRVPSFQLDNEYKRFLKDRFDDKMSDLVAALEAESKTLTDFRKDLEENMMAEAMRGRFRRSLPSVTPEQVQAYYEQHQADFASEASIRLAVIELTPLADEPQEVLLQTAESIKTQIEEGLTFEQAAKEHSQDPSAKQGGDWGFVKLDELSEELRAVLKDLPTGTVSAPVLLEGPKVMLLKIVERRNEAVPALEELRPTIENRLREQSAREAYLKWMAELKAKNFVKVTE